MDPMPPASSHVRGIQIRLPRFTGKPTVTATVYSETSPGPAFAVYQILLNNDVAPSFTYCTIYAVSVNESVQDYPYFCSYTVIGKLAR